MTSQNVREEKYFNLKDFPQGLRFPFSPGSQSSQGRHMAVLKQIESKFENQ